jgi:hypothetical protein
MGGRALAKLADVFTEEQMPIVAQWLEMAAPCIRSERSSAGTVVSQIVKAVTYSYIDHYIQRSMWKA